MISFNTHSHWRGKPKTAPNKQACKLSVSTLVSSAANGTINPRFIRTCLKTICGAVKTPTEEFNWASVIVQLRSLRWNEWGKKKPLLILLTASTFFPAVTCQNVCSEKGALLLEPDVIFTVHIHQYVLGIFTPELMLSEQMLPSVHSSFLIKWCGVLVAGAPSVSRWQSKKGTGHWAAPRESCGKQSMGQNAISSLYHALMALGTDGQISRRQRYARDYAFHLCEYLWVHGCGSAQDCTCARTAGVRGPN